MATIEIVRDDDDALVVRAALGSDWHVLGWRASLFLIGIFLALALVSLFALGRTRTLTCRRDPAVCELRDKGIVSETTEIFPREQVVGVEVEQSLRKCRAKLRTKRGGRDLNPIWTVRCIDHRRNAATVNAFLASPSDPPLIVRFEERTMFLIYTTGNFGAVVFFSFVIFWPGKLTMRVDRRKRIFRFRRSPVWPWHRGSSRVVPIARVAKLSMENVTDSHLRVELELDDESSVIVRSERPVDPDALALARERVLAALAKH
jgi:hypothetical protein